MISGRKSVSKRRFPSSHSEDCVHPRIFRKKRSVLRVKAVIGLASNTLKIEQTKWSVRVPGAEELRHQIKCRFFIADFEEGLSAGKPVPFGLPLFF